MADFNTEKSGTFESTTSTTSTPGTGQTKRDLREKAGEYASKAKEGAKDALTTGKNKLEDARHSTASGLERAASWAHESANRVPGGETSQRAVHAVANGMNRSATYLREHDISQMGSDVQNYVRRHPGPSIAIAVGLGFLLGSRMRRR